MTHICVGKLIIIGSDNGLSPGRRQAIIWTNAGILLIWPLGRNFSEILIDIQAFSFKKMHLKISSVKWRPFCLGLNVLSDLTSHLNPSHLAYFGMHPIMLLTISQIAMLAGPMLAQRRYCRPDVGPTLTQPTLLYELLMSPCTSLNTIVTSLNTAPQPPRWSFGWWCCRSQRHRTQTIKCT